ncbi:unnamed protein product, partial [Musa acuminata var. zebrina]
MCHRFLSTMAIKPMNTLTRKMELRQSDLHLCEQQQRTDACCIQSTIAGTNEDEERQNHLTCPAKEREKKQRFHLHDNTCSRSRSPDSAPTFSGLIEEDVSSSLVEGIIIISWCWTNDSTLLYSSEPNERERERGSRCVGLWDAEEPFL